MSVSVCHARGGASDDPRVRAEPLAPHDRFAVRVEGRLLEAASLVRDGRTVWVPTWSATGSAFATRDTFRAIVEGFVRNYVREFGDLYRRARSPAVETPASPAH